MTKRFNCASRNAAQRRVRARIRWRRRLALTALAHISEPIANSGPARIRVHLIRIDRDVWKASCDFKLRPRTNVRASSKEHDVFPYRANHSNQPNHRLHTLCVD